jgi:hypothetical protein
MSSPACERESAGAVAVIVPSPLAGEGSSESPPAMMGEGLLSRKFPLTHSNLFATHCALSRTELGLARVRHFKSAEVG